jgi:hypothetical protein
MRGNVVECEKWGNAIFIAKNHITPLYQHILKATSLSHSITLPHIIALPNCRITKLPNLLVHFRKVLMEIGDRFDAFVVVGDVILLVRRVNVVIVQSEAEQYGFEAECFFK